MAFKKSDEFRKRKIAGMKWVAHSIFSTKREAVKLAKSLRAEGHKARVIHDNKSEWTVYVPKDSSEAFWW